MLLVAVGCLLVPLPREMASERAYGFASACDPGLWLDSCVGVTEGSVAVRDAERDDGYWLTLVDLRTKARYDVEMSGRGPVWEVVRRGDRVTLLYWRSEIRAVGFDEARQDVAGAPPEYWLLAGVHAGALAPAAVYLLWAAWWVGRRYRADMLARPWQVRAARHACVALMWVGGSCGLAAGSVAFVFLIPAAALPVVAVAALVARWRQRRFVGKVAAVVPERPARRAVLRVRVHGDVPGVVNGSGFLVTGGRTSATRQDPAALPGLLSPTLTAVRVRPVLRDDPPGLVGPFAKSGVVIECRDGDTPVLLATRLRDAPVVLGALPGAVPAMR